jgi:predicted small lipoprotein YifL
MSARRSRLAAMAGSALAVCLFAGCGLKGPLSLPEKPGEVTIRPSPTGTATGSPQAPAGQEAPAGQPAPPGQKAPGGAGSPPAPPEETLPQPLPGEGDATGG